MPHDRLPAVGAPRAVPTGRARLARAFAVALASACATLAVADLVLRLRPPSTPGRYRLLVQDADGGRTQSGTGHDPYLRHRESRGTSDELVYELRPDVRLRYEYPPGGRPYLDAGNGVEARTNASGRRGPDVAREKPARTWRVAVVGDSNTFGHGVPEEATWARALERDLAARLAPAGLACEVLNGGVPGYDVRDCAAYLRERLLAYDPDVVVYGFFLNDVLDGASLLELPEFRERARAFHERFGDRIGVESPARGLFALVASLRARRAYAALVVSLYRAAFRPESPAWRACAARILAMRAGVEARGGRFVLLVLPQLFAMGADYPLDEAHATIRAWGAQHGVRVVDALELLRAHDAAELRVHPRDAHYDEVAHALVARAAAPACLPGPAPGSGG